MQLEPLRFKNKTRRVEFHNAQQAFLKQFPVYRHTALLDQVRSEEFSRLEQAQQVYLDYTGASLYSEALTQNYTKKLNQWILANPHSHSAPSVFAAKQVDDVRELILDYFCDKNREYQVIFTTNATAAIRLVAEAFPFTSQSALLLTEDNHNSIHGIREFARQKDANIDYAPVDTAELRIIPHVMSCMIREKPSGFSLFAMPAQSNLSGVKHDLDWIQQAKSYRWYTLLDAAAFTPTNPLNLSKVQPDFMCFSFYKMFGFPTGVGCLLAHNESLSILNRPWFGGGSVVNVSVVDDSHISASGVEAFEDGTVNFGLIPAVKDGLALIERLNIATIQQRTHILTEWMLEQLIQLQHRNGAPLIKLFGPQNMQNRGATLAFHVLDDENQIWLPALIEDLASERNISMRTGYHCNPGCIERIHQLSDADKAYLFDPNESDEERLCRQQERMPGVIRLSFGMVSNFTDAWLAVEFLSNLLDKKANDWEGIDG